MAESALHQPRRMYRLRSLGAECPWQAIFEEAVVPEMFEADIALNHATLLESPTTSGLKALNRRKLLHLNWWRRTNLNGA